MIFQKLKWLVFLFATPLFVCAQNIRQLTLTEAIAQGIANSKNLKLSQNKIDQLNAHLETLKDDGLPNGTASLMYNHAEIPQNKLNLGGGNPFVLPLRSDVYIGTASLTQAVYAGGRLKLAKESTKLLTEVAGLDAEKNKEEVTFAIISTYYSLYKVQQSKKVVAQNLQSIAQQIKQAERFFEQGLVTKNDVLRFQLQQANVSLVEMEIENNQKVINYNLVILLGLPEDTELDVSALATPAVAEQPLATYLNLAYTNRQELKQLVIRDKVSEVGIKTIKANALPTFGLAANLYYLNPSGSFIPQTQQYLLPATIGANLSWNFGALWTNKHKIAEAKVQQAEIGIQKSMVLDQVKTDVNKNYQNFDLALKKIAVLETAIAQASENDRLLASKYKNNIASATDRIDAETQLYQAKINLEVAKADAGLAYYQLLKSTGKTAE